VSLVGEPAFALQHMFICFATVWLLHQWSFAVILFTSQYQPTPLIWCCIMLQIWFHDGSSSLLWKIHLA